MRWRELWNRIRTGEEDSVDDPSQELADARAGRADAEAKLEDTRQKGYEVTRVSDNQRRLRGENNFSARWEQAFGRRRG